MALAPAAGLPATRKPAARSGGAPFRDQLLQVIRKNAKKLPQFLFRRTAIKCVPYLLGRVSKLQPNLVNHLLRLFGSLLFDEHRRSAHRAGNRVGVKNHAVKGQGDWVKPTEC